MLLDLLFQEIIVIRILVRTWGHVTAAAARIPVIVLMAGWENNVIRVSDMGRGITGLGA